MSLRIIDDLKDSTSSALRQAELMTAVALAIAIAIAFLCAAAFVFVFENYGLIPACLAGAGVFLIVAAVVAAIYTVRRRRIQALARQRARTTAHSLLTDPVVVATGLQIARAIGMKRMVPLLAVGGLALGLLASRNASEDPAHNPAPAE